METRREPRESTPQRTPPASGVGPCRVTGSESIAALTKAMRAARRSFGAVVKDKTNPHFRSHYADLAGILDAIEEALDVNGLLLLHSTRWEAGELWLDTTIEHESGEWIASVYPLFASSYTDPQKIGGALTYARRYVVQMMLGIAPEDDDGETANGRGAGRQQPRRPDRDHQATDRRTVNEQFPRRVEQGETWSKWIGPELARFHSEWRHEMTREGVEPDRRQEYAELSNEPREVNYLCTRLIELGRIAESDVTSDRKPDVRDPRKARAVVEDFFARKPGSIKTAVARHLAEKRSKTRAELGMPDDDEDDVQAAMAANGTAREPGCDDE